MTNVLRVGSSFQLGTQCMYVWQSYKRTQHTCYFYQQ